MNPPDSFRLERFRYEPSEIDDEDDEDDLPGLISDTDSESDETQVVIPTKPKFHRTTTMPPGTQLLLHSMQMSQTSRNLRPAVQKGCLIVVPTTT